MSAISDWNLVSRSIVLSVRSLQLRFWLFWGLFLGATAMIASPFDFIMFEWVKSGQSKEAGMLAGFLDQIGKNAYINLVGVVILSALAILWKCRRMRRVAMSFFLASLLSGISVQIIKPLVGRPRPSECLEKQIDSTRLSGPTFRNRLHSYPSGHTATTAAGCAVLAIFFPRLLVPCVSLAIAMAWSRIYAQSHFPLDTLHGALIGYLCAFLSTRWLDTKPHAEADTAPELEVLA
jgi:membrane-associated phospholipid phosphatase